jgi:hypothetical protein
MGGEWPPGKPSGCCVAADLKYTEPTIAAMLGHVTWSTTDR